MISKELARNTKTWGRAVEGRGPISYRGFAMEDSPLEDGEISFSSTSNALFPSRRHCSGADEPY
jgi:hypothetical protein